MIPLEACKEMKRWLALAPLIFILLTPAVSGGFTATLLIEILDVDGHELKYKSLLPTVKLEGQDYSEVLKCYNCTFTPFIDVNESPLSFDLSVKWMGVTVYEGKVDLVNGTTKSLSITANVSRVKIEGIDDADTRVKCSLHLTGPTSLDVTSGDTIPLPLGVYQVSKVSLKLASGVEYQFPLGEKINVTRKDKAFKISLPVADKVLLRIVKSDGSPLSSEALITIYILTPEKPIVYNGTLGEKGIVILGQIPYATYLVEAYWMNTRVLSTLVSVNPDAKNFTLKSEIVSGVKIRVLDWDGSPVANSKVTLKGPKGTLTLHTDNNGIIELLDALPGFYNVSISFMGDVASSPLYLKSQGIETILLPVRRLEVTVKARWASTLPPGLKARLIHERSNTLLGESLLTSERDEISFTLNDYLPVSTKLRLEVYWNDSWLYEERFEPISSRYEVDMPFSDITVTLVNIHGSPLPGAEIMVTDAVRTMRRVTDEYGRARFKHLYGRSIRVKAYWEDILVADEELDEGDVKATLKSYVYPLSIRVEGALGQPLTGVYVEAKVEGAGVHLTFQGVTGSDGTVYFEGLPLPPGSGLFITASKGRINARRLVTVDEAKARMIVLSTNILVDVQWLQLTVFETIILILTLMAIGLTAFKAYRVYARRREAMEMIREYTIGWEAGKESFSQRIRERLKTLLGIEEKEEEEGVFEEL